MSVGDKVGVNLSELTDEELDVVREHSIKRTIELRNERGNVAFLQKYIEFSSLLNEVAKEKARRKQAPADQSTAEGDTITTPEGDVVIFKTRRMGADGNIDSGVTHLEHESKLNNSDEVKSGDVVSVLMPDGKLTP